MWRLANYIYRAFRNGTTHRCPQDIIVPATTICKKDDESSSEGKEHNPVELHTDIDRVIKTHQFLSPNLEQVLQRLQKIAYQQLTPKPPVIEPSKGDSRVQDVQPPTSPPIQQEPTVDALLQADETYVNTVKNLSELNAETMSLIDNQMAIDALNSGDAQRGVEMLHASAKSGKNAAALYNLGICYERGIGVEEDRAKACDYYRRASMLGHVNAQFNLNLLSNQIDTDDLEDESIEQTTATNKPFQFRFSFAKNYKEEPSQSWNDYPLNLTKTLACLS